MKKIKEHTIEEIREFCVKLLSKTFLELRQKTTAEDTVAIAIGLAEDLIIDFPKLTLKDIEQSFRQGVRKGDEFHLNVPTMYKWIKAHRQLIWDNHSKEIEHQDKRLNYRNSNRKIEHLSKQLNVNINKLKN